eukprot:2918868-Amphidinium_carterae.1
MGDGSINYLGSVPRTVPKTEDGGLCAMLKGKPVAKAKGKAKQNPSGGGLFSRFMALPPRNQLCAPPP